ncbi:UDP-N-acetylmuramoylalanine--D-glutamate ligase [Bryobacterales bacterium F-183]|nr:UDP-N-acetylmuramoylalanine--D-glutamate ligase [Bryobacterales bacterium F-183]
MTPILQGKTVLVAGMAKSGLAAIDLLRQKGATVIACDSKELATLPHTTRQRLADLEFRIQSPEAFTGIDFAVLSPGVPLDAVPAGVAVMGELELASHFLQGPHLGITGSNGKTTTTSMIGHILRHAGVACQVGGNIGTPPAAMIDSSRDGQWNVLELSSYQLETVEEFSAQIGVCLNVTPDHLDRHKTMENYAAAKGRLFETLSASGFAVLNADNDYCRGYAEQTKAQTHWFSLHRKVDPGMWLEDGAVRYQDGVFVHTSELPLRGLHNVENVMAASLSAILAGASVDKVREGVLSFHGVEHRLEFVRKVRGVDYFNDSKATNVDATIKALEAFSGGLWVILGGKDKDSDYTLLRDLLQSKARRAVLIGAAASKIADQIQGACPIEQAGTIQNAVQIASTGAAPGDTVLLAPACASFDQFESYEHRGRVFKSLIHELRET